MTKEGWKNLSPKQQWDVQVALRGPDTQDSEPIKWFTTAVIRGAMKGVIRVGGTVNDNLSVIVVPKKYHHNVASKLWDRLTPEAKEMIPHRLLWNSGHFFQHVVEAAMHLGIPVVSIDDDTYWSLIETNNIHKIITGFVEYVEKKGPTFFPTSILKALKDHDANLNPSPSNLISGGW